MVDKDIDIDMGIIKLNNVVIDGSIACFHYLTGEFKQSVYDFLIILWKLAASRMKGRETTGKEDNEGKGKDISYLI